MLTIFTCPKPFNNKIGLIQTNAINSWRRLDPKIQIVLVGNDLTVKKFALRNKLDFVGGVRSNNYGTPYVDSIFELADRKSKHNVLAYVNSDIILFDDFLNTIKAIKRMSSKFLVVGQRYDLELNGLIDFSDMRVIDKLFNFVHQKGKKHGPTGMDYFIFKKGTLGEISAFLVGRDSWDNWMIYNALNRGIKVIEATNAITALHQNHDYLHLTKKKKSVEELSNDILAKGKMSTMNDVNYVLDKDLNLRKKSFIELRIPRLVVLIKLNLCYLYNRLINE